MRLALVLLTACANQVGDVALVYHCNTGYGQWYRELDLCWPGDAEDLEVSLSEWHPAPITCTPTRDACLYACPSVHACLARNGCWCE